MQGTTQPHSTTLKRPLSNEGAGLPEPKARRDSEETADERTARWWSQLTLMSGTDLHAVSQFIEKVAHQAVTISDTQTAQCVFNILIRASGSDKEPAPGPIELFAELFTCFNACLKIDTHDRVTKDPSTHGHPVPQAFEAMLCLQLPRRWLCAHSARLADVFQSLQVERLEVIRPYWDPNDNALGFHDPIEWDPIPDGACEIVAMLLRNGSVKTLHVDGPLASHVVADALIGNTTLHSVEFTTHTFHAGEIPLTEADLQSYENLTRALGSCQSLKHVGLGHSELVKLSDAIAAFLQPDGPRLDSITLQFPNTYIRLPSNQVDHANGDITSALTTFMKTVRKTESLRSFKADVNFAMVDTLRAVFLENLKGLPNLSELHIGSGMPLDVVAQNMQGFPIGLKFSLTCPKLRKMAFISPWMEGSAAEMEHYRAMGGDLHMDTGIRDVENTMKNPGFALDEFSFHGHHILAGQTYAFANALPTNTTLTRFSFLDCCKHFRASLKLIAAVGKNDRIEMAEMPKNHENYWFEGSDGAIHGFRWNDDFNDSGAGEAPPTNFVLEFAEDVSPAAREAAEADFAPLKPQADTFFTSLASTLEQRRLARRANAQAGIAVATTSTTNWQDSLGLSAQELADLKGYYDFDTAFADMDNAASSNSSSSSASSSAAATHVTITTTTTTSTTTSTTTTGTMGTLGTTPSTEAQLRSTTETEKPQ